MSVSESVILNTPLFLRHSWPIWEQARQFELGQVINSAVTDLLVPQKVGDLGLHHAGCWECDLSDNSLIWSGGVYDLFGLPRGVKINRDVAVASYCEESRAKMERLRAYAIAHRRGFTIDVEIRVPGSEKRWLRLIAAPVCVGDRAMRLHGLKVAI
jgi:hypothetical protein